MKETTIFCRPGLGKPAARKFEQEVNDLLKKGWQLSPEGVVHKPRGPFGLAYILLATLTKGE